MTGLVKPTVGGDYDTWGPIINAALDYLDGQDAKQLTVVSHGSVAATARLSSALPVLWIGTVDPTNAAARDIVFREDVPAFKRYTGSVWTQVGGTSLPSNFLTKTANFTAAAGDFIRANTTSGGFTITLPSNPAVGAIVAVKNTGTGSNTLTVAASGAGSIDGTAAVTTTTPLAGAIYEHVGSDVWHIAAVMTTTGPPGQKGDTGATGPAATAVTLTTQSSTAYTLALADAGTEIETTNGSGVTVTVPPNSSVALPVGTIINLRQYGAGQVTAAAGAGVTLRSANGLKTRAQYSTLSLVKRATDEWIVSGDSTV